MVNDTMKTLSLLALCMLTTQALANSSPESDVAVTQTTFVGQRVDLINDDGQCALARSDDSLLRLDVKWPCQFSRNLQKQVVIKNFRTAEIVMVEHSASTRFPDQDCATDTQSIRYFKGKVETAPVRRVSACLPTLWDQKDFTWLFDW